MIEGIYGFDGKYEFLSNFYPSPFYVMGQLWPTVEHYYQACKAVHPSDAECIRNLVSPGAAKRAGRLVEKRVDWEEIKVEIMRMSLIFKFYENKDLRFKLIGTGDLYIEETNNWNDTFWGVCDGKGQNVLGNLLMEVREKFR